MGYGRRIGLVGNFIDRAVERDLSFVLKTFSLRMVGRSKLLARKKISIQLIYNDKTTTFWVYLL